MADRPLYEQTFDARLHALCDVIRRLCRDLEIQNYRAIRVELGRRQLGALGESLLLEDRPRYLCALLVDIYDEDDRLVVVGTDRSFGDSSFTRVHRSVAARWPA